MEDNIIGIGITIGIISSIAVVVIYWLASKERVINDVKKHTQIEKPRHEDKLESYSENGFWVKCKKYAKDIGRESMDKTYNSTTLESENCTAKHKAIIYGALAYLVSPIDAIPDLTPILGYTDDMGVIAGALIAVATCIDEKTKAKAKAKLNEWFS